MILGKGGKEKPICNAVAREADNALWYVGCQMHGLIASGIDFGKAASIAFEHNVE